MKNLMPRCLLVVLLLLSAGCAMRSPEEEAALLYAKSIDMVLVEADFAGREVFTGLPCVLVVQTGLLITGLDGASGNSMKDYVLPDKQPRYFWSGNKPLFFPPGKHTISVLVGSRANEPQASLSFTFAEGKHYTLDYVLHPDRVSFIFGEITDEAKLAALAEEIAEKREKSEIKAGALASYLSFAKENPAWLEGKWSVGPEKDELEFSGNTVRYVAAKSLFFDARNTLEGVFMFNRNSMVIQWNSLRTPANSLTRAEKPDAFEDLLVYYILNGDTLEIRHRGIFPANISGTYKRVR
ncbi:MAG: hypothetical protein LBM64_09065 [Deltaproteobacteria bacterium]|jgi:hypothetical protein|nr:hypothetical protein [Deltaproteobacteria bacterium]